MAFWYAVKHVKTDYCEIWHHEMHLVHLD